MIGRHGLARAAWLAATLVITGVPAGGRTLAPEEREALAQVDARQNEVWAQCGDAQGGKHLITRVVPNTGVAPPSARPGAALSGFYDLILYKNVDGQTRLGLEEKVDPLTVADQQNGIEARYRVRLTVPAYRVYDPRTGGGSPWNSGSSWDREKVNFANYAVTKQHGAWGTDVSYNILTDGRFERPDCGAVPR